MEVIEPGHIYDLNQLEGRLIVEAVPIGDDGHFKLKLDE